MITLVSLFLAFSTDLYHKKVMIFIIIFHDRSYHKRKWWKGWTMASSIAKQGVNETSRVLGWHRGIWQRATNKKMTATHNSCRVFGRNLQQLARFGSKPTNNYLQAKFSRTNLVRNHSGQKLCNFYLLRIARYLNTTQKSLLHRFVRGSGWNINPGVWPWVMGSKILPRQDTNATAIQVVYLHRASSNPSCIMIMWQNALSINVSPR